jgi:SAM-dependent MidA family methyltransferase
MAALMTFAQRWQGHDFYTQHRAEEHFITAPMVADQVARAIADRLERAWPSPVDVFDIGAGDGSLVRALAARTNHTLHGVDVRPRPAHLSAQIEWHRELPTCDRAVIICHEFLDDVPCEIVEVDEDGHPRLVVLDDDGAQFLGPSLTDPSAGPDREWLLRWMQRWWPTKRPFSRVDIGLQRDLTWQHLLTRIQHGQAFAIDYGHLLSERLIGTWDAGTAIGFERGRSAGTAFIPSRNITAHVALDAVAHASGAHQARLTRQRRIIRAPAPYGFSTGALDDYLWLEVRFDRRSNA